MANFLTLERAMNKQKLTVLGVVKRSGVSRRTGLPWEMYAAQCALEQGTADGGSEILVGQINLPEQLRGVSAGDYLAEFALAQSMEGRLEPRIVSLVPFGKPTAKAASGAAVA
ncbi:hypothetical protein NLI96_g13237 [Meripilus lineatus]|uniref:Cellulose synthase n=1 Tax=Meripilus lineatus TaxID=2056292 RepID=A0AAD5Y948_9APHY|nr:hypothetical protein NLI96_g13237 [Physisporinus lineatus]